jgi:hypothetical protein
VEERCFRDTGKRSDDVEVEVMASEVSGRGRGAMNVANHSTL